MVPQENHNWAQVWFSLSLRGTHNLPNKLVAQGNCLLWTHTFCEKKDFRGAVWGTEWDALLIFYSPDLHLHTSCLLRPGLTHLDYLHEPTPLIQMVKQAVLHGAMDLDLLREGALQHEQLCPARTGNQAGGRGYLSHPVTILLCYLQHTNTTKRSGEQPAAHSHFNLQEAPLWRGTFCPQPSIVLVYAHLT